MESFLSVPLLNRFSRRQNRIFSIVLSLIFTALVLYTAAEGPSLTQDDHWYMSDLKTFLETGRMQTNQIYPHMLKDGPDQPPRVLHNLPLIYLAAPAALLLGVYWGWIVTNLLFTLLTCFILSMFIRRLGGKPWQQLLFTLMFYVWIETLHVSSHPLAEAGVLFFLACLALYLVFYLKGYLSHIVLGILTALVILNRPSFLTLLFFLPVLLLLEKNGLKHRLSGVFLFLVTAALTLVIGYRLLPQVRFSVLTPLCQSHNNAMQQYFQSEPLSFSLIVFLQHIWETAKLQLGGRDIYQTAFVTLFNLIFLLFLVCRDSSTTPERKRFYRLLVAFALTYLATLFCFQFQTRFLHTILPFLLVWLVLELPFFRFPQAAVVFVSAFILINLAGVPIYAQRNRQEGRLTAQVEAAYRQLIQQHSLQGAIVFIDNGRIAPWIFRGDKQLLMLDSRYGFSDELKLMRDKYKIDWVICQADPELCYRLQPLLLHHVATLPEPMSEFHLYSVRQPWQRLKP